MMFAFFGRCIRVAVFGTAAALTLPGSAAAAGDHGAGAHLRIRGTVVSIDAKQRIVLVRHIALETMPEETVACRLSGVHHPGTVRVGSSIEATADTSRHPWTLTDVHVKRGNRLVPA